MTDNIKTLLLIVIVSLFAGFLVVTLSGCDVKQSTVQSGGAPIVVIPEQPADTEPVEIVPINE